MHNKRIKIRSAFCGINMRDGFRILRIRRKAVDRFGGNRDNLTGVQKLPRRRNCSVISGYNPAIPQGI